MSSNIAWIQRAPTGPFLRGVLSRTIVEAFLRSPQRMGESSSDYRLRIDSYRLRLRERSPQELLNKAFSNWRNPVLSEIRGGLTVAGLHDLFAATQAGIAEHAARVLELNPAAPGQTRSDLDIAILLFRSISQTDRVIVLDNGRSKLTINPLPPERGGLDVRYDTDLINVTPLVPAAIISKPNGERFAVCHEHGALFISLLRAVGLNGQIKCCDGHTSVLLESAGEKYQFDLTSGSPRITIVPAGRKGAPDRRGIARYYTFLADKATHPGILPDLTPAERTARLQAGLKMADLATELYPSDASNWTSRATVLLSLGRVSEARETAEAALQVNENDVVAKDIIEQADRRRNIWDTIRWTATKIFRIL